MSSTGRDVTFGGKVEAPDLASNNIRSRTSVHISIDDDDNQDNQHFLVRKNGAGNYTDLFRVNELGHTSINEGDLRLDKGGFFLKTIGPKQNTWAQVMVRDAATGKLSYREAPTLTPWKWNDVDIRYGQRVAIGSTATSPSTTLDVFGDVKVRTLVENSALNEMVVANANNKLLKRNINTLVGGRDNSLEKLVVVNGGNMMQYRDLSSLNLSPFTIVPGTIGYTGQMNITGNGNFTSIAAGSAAIGNHLQTGILSASSATFNGNLSGTSANFSGPVSSGALTASSANVAGDLSAGNAMVSGLTASTVRINGLSDVSEIDRLVTVDDFGNLQTFQVEGGSGLSPWTRSGNHLSYTEGTVTTAQLNAGAESDQDIGLSVKNASTNQDVFRVYGNGHILGKKLELPLSNWYDEVFEPDYELRSLQELEEFIGENKHLPEIPSEQEVLKHGVDVGEMEGLLLKKIEELTLYIIEQNKQLQAQNEELAAQNERIEQLESKLK